MPEEQTELVTLRADFYRDRFKMILLLVALTGGIIVLVIALSIYLYVVKPPPITFPVSNGWRVQPTVALDQPYHTTSDILQWVSDAIPRVFQYDFNHYEDQLRANSHYFTEEGRRVFLNQLSNYVDNNVLQKNRLFVQPVPTGAPYILNQGLLSGRYGWWVQMPILLSYIGNIPLVPQKLNLQVLVVRVPTVNNLFGVAINNIVVQGKLA